MSIGPAWFKSDVAADEISSIDAEVTLGIFKAAVGISGTESALGADGVTFGSADVDSARSGSVSKKKNIYGKGEKYRSDLLKEYISFFLPLSTSSIPS